MKRGLGDFVCFHKTLHSGCITLLIAKLAVLLQQQQQQTITIIKNINNNNNNTTSHQATLLPTPTHKYITHKYTRDYLHRIPPFVHSQSPHSHSLIPTLNNNNSHFLLTTQPKRFISTSQQNVNQPNVETPHTISLIDKYCSPWMIPYLRLIRIDRPIGTWLLFWPGCWSIALAASPGDLPNLILLSTFGIGSIIMRGAGCTINDMADSEFDKKVERTRSRPLASGSITHKQAVAFLGIQLSIGLCILLSLNAPSILLGASSLFFVVTYPFMKRITWYPQAFLGLTFNWGALLGYTAVTSTFNLPVILPLYLAGVCWTMVYDTIYAHMDKKDDVFLGVKSTALKFGKYNRPILSLFALGTIGFLAISGFNASQTFPFYFSLALASSHLFWQIFTVNFENGSDCMKKFVSNKVFGAIVFFGIVIGTLFKVKKSDKSDKSIVGNVSNDNNNSNKAQVAS